MKIGVIFVTKLENVLYALRCRAIDNPSACNECPYYIAKWYCCDARHIMKDALDLLEKQEKKIRLNYLTDKNYQDNLFELQEGIRQLHNLSESLNREEEND